MRLLPGELRGSCHAGRDVVGKSHVSVVTRLPTGVGMNNTITIDNVPSGFELTGEYRGPRAGEYFLSCNGDAHSCDIDCLARYPILRKLEPPEPPAGWELTGEYRAPVVGEFYKSRDFDTVHQTTKNDAGFFADETRKRWIVREAWQAPAWMPKGCWLWHKACGVWFITRHRPASTESGFMSCESVSAIRVDTLAALHGETFTPPTHTNCLKIQ